ncbi:helix-turn-helix domain-containing protein [Listeria goaensis]|uniref:helix-turn-helix domain-containing protein n=1 Tax=Listeria goaensis TaxID=1649188 RepID=UPI000B58BED4|nr:helix-turn-helix transcriptional regulator [Listeria goaensis]
MKLKDNLFRQNLKAVRLSRGLSQTELAEKVGLTKNSIINYEKGVTFPTGGRLQRLLDVLQVTPEHLFGPDILKKDSEDALLDELQTLASFEANYTFLTQTLPEDRIEEEARKLLFHTLHQLKTTDIYTALQLLYHSKVDLKEKVYLRELQDDILNSMEPRRTPLPDMDIHLAYEEDEPDEK